MHDRLTAPDAPVTIAELVETFGKTARGWRKRADRENWPSADGACVYQLSGVPGELREKITARREQRLARAVEVHAAGAREALRHEKLPADYTDQEQDRARAKADFILDVERMKRERPSLEYRDCVRAVVLRANAIHPHPFLPLLDAGRKGNSALELGNNSGAKSFPAFTNFRNWKERWRPFHGEFKPQQMDRFQYWVLCDRRDEGAEKRAGEYKQEGDPRFWVSYRQRYESTKKPGHQECYKECEALARKYNWTDLPTPKQVRYYYDVKLSDSEKRLVEKAREGRKHHYDTLDIYIIRDWRRVEPDECWSFDGHMLDVMVRVWDPVRRGWAPERPWLVNAIDSCSWYEVGRHFTLVPAQDSVEYTIRNAQERYRRAPRLFYFDNGREFKAAGKKLVMNDQRLNEICDNLGIEAVYALPYNPRAKVNERDYRNIVRWFEAKQPTYIGNAAINKSNFDQRWHDLHKPGAPLERDGRGCLKNPLLVPELKDLAALYDAYREQDHHQRVRTGRICPNQSPAQKYLANGPRRVLEDWEIATGFLRVLGPQTVTEQARVWYLPSGCKKGEEIWYQDEKLMEFRDCEVVVKFDVAAMRAFAYEIVRGDDLRLIKCSGEFGSVPREFLPHPFQATQEDIRGKKRTYSKWQRTRRAGDHATRLEIAANELAAETARNEGITEGQAKTYVIKTDDVVARAEGNERKDQHAQDARAKLRELVTDEAREAYRTGKKS